MVLGTTHKRLVAFDKNGLLVWNKIYTYGTVGFTLDEQGNVIVSALVSGAKKIQKLNALTGELIVEKIVSTNESGYISSPTVDYSDGSIYASLNMLTKLDKELNIVWQKPDLNITSEVVVDKNSNIILSTHTGIFKLNSSGEEIWRVDNKQLYGPENTVGFSPLDAPSIDANGIVYVGVTTNPQTTTNNYTFMSIGDKVIQDYCTYYDMLEQKLDNGTLTETERLKAIENAEDLLVRLNEFVPEPVTVIE
jgi:outer membrane protein assembly factor BamB